MRSPARYLSIIRGQPNPARFVISRLLRLLHLSHLVTMTVPPSVRLRLYPTSLSEMYWMAPDAREADHRFLEAYLASGMTVVDVGANIGALTIHASKKVGPVGRVISIEAHRRVFSYLLGNLRLNRCSNVEAINVAVGSSPGTVIFSDLKQDDINHVVGPAQQATPDPARYGKHLPMAWSCLS